MRPNQRIERRRIPGLTVAVLGVMILAFPQILLAKYKIEFTPTISVREEYDDNINLDSKDEESDYITTVSPGFDLHIRSEKNDLALRYSPGFVWYDKNSQNDTVRHSGTLTFYQDLAEHLRFDLSDTYLKSEDPLEDTEDVEGVRNTRNKYTRNNGKMSLTYIFGENRSMVAGYGHSLLRNEDVTIDDSDIQNAFWNFSHWFNVENGLEMDYQYTRADFWTEDESEAGDDYKGHNAGIRYLRRFTPHTTGSGGYGFTTRSFEGTTEDYDVHEISLGVDHAFTKDLSVSVKGGLFTQKNERSDDETGYTYDASVIKTFERGRFTFGGEGGWDEAYQEAERRGFTRFWSLASKVDYQILEKVTGYAGGFYRNDEDSAGRQWMTLRGNCGLKWSFARWFSLSLDYSYAERDDDVDTDDYSDNRVMLLISASRPYEW